MNHRFTGCLGHVAGILMAGVSTVVLLPGLALADEPPDLLAPRSFNISLGTFILEQDTDIRFDGASGAGSDLNWERVFGDEDDTRFRVDAFWRFADRHKVRFVWFNNSTGGSRVLDEDIEWGGVTYPVGVKATGEFDFDVYELAYEYAFLRRESWEVTGSVGLHWTSIALALTGEAQVGGEDSVEGEVRREGSADLPLPVVGLRGLWNIGGAFWLDVSAQYFSLSIDDVDGRLTDFRAAALWQPKKWLGLGLGYNRFAVDVDVDSDTGTDDFSGSLDWTYQGPILFLSATF